MRHPFQNLPTTTTATSTAIALFHLSESECIDVAQQNPPAIANMLLANRSPAVLLAALNQDRNISMLLCPADILQKNAQPVRDFLMENNCALREATQDALDAAEGVLEQHISSSQDRG